MLDWMKKLFKKEEENEAIALSTIETPVEKKATSQIPRVKYYSDKREDELQALKSNADANFRFPLIPDNGFDEITQESSRLEKLAIRERPIRERRQSRRVEEVQEMTYVEPSTERVRNTPKVESKRRPFRPTEIVSPIFGYNRPEARKKENEESKQQREDIEISMEGKSVVDAWLEKNGYISSDVSQDGVTEVEPAIVKANAEQTVDIDKNEATLHTHEEEKLGMSEDVILEDLTQQIHTFENEVQEPTVVEISTEEPVMEAEESAETEESVEEEVIREASEITEEPVIEEATVEAEESVETEESVEEEVIREASEITEEPVMEEATVEAEESAETEESVEEEVISEALEITEEPVIEEATVEAEESAETEESVEEEVIREASEITEEPVIEEATVEAEESVKTEESVE
ncbi:TPA: hypothetical protein ROX88_002066, partial [Bacillus pseudomycoides]|nr:hypothetical protein [Bacillus pseudomycoides]